MTKGPPVYDSPGYRRIHRRLRRVRGPAKNYDCISCRKPAQCWAYQKEDGTQYSDDIEDYAPMCESCHRKLDWSLLSAENRENRLMRVWRVRRKCGDCEMVTTSGPLVRHQKVSGHIGYEEMS
jgi:hypothetical protein